jgi:hypothetical protein
MCSRCWQIAAGPCVAAAIYILDWGGDISSTQATPPPPQTPSPPPSPRTPPTLRLLSPQPPDPHTFPPSQLLLTGSILAASAVAASVAAAKFWEHHSSPQLLGLASAPPNHRCNNANFDPRALSASFDFFDAARDFVWGMIAGALGTARVGCFCLQRRVCNVCVVRFCNLFGGSFCRILRAVAWRGRRRCYAGYIQQLCDKMQKNDKLSRRSPSKSQRTPSFLFLKKLCSGAICPSPSHAHGAKVYSI